MLRPTYGCLHVTLLHCFILLLDLKSNFVPDYLQYVGSERTERGFNFFPILFQEIVNGTESPYEMKQLSLYFHTLVHHAVCNEFFVRCIHKAIKPSRK